MSKVTLTEIRKAVEAAGGEYTKLSMRLNGHDAYRVNGEVFAKPVLIEAYKNGLLTAPKAVQEAHKAASI